MSNDAKIINDPDDVRTPDAPPSRVSPHLEIPPNGRRDDKTVPPSAPALALVGWTGLAFALTLVNVSAGHWFPLPAYPSLGAHVLALLYLATILFALLQAARAAARLPQSTGFLLATAAILAAPLLLSVTGLIDLPYHLSLIAKNLLGVFAGALAGAGIGRIIRHPNTLLAAAGFALFFDIVVVTLGTVAQAAQNNSRLIAAVSIGAGAGLSDTPINPRRPPVEPISGVTIGPADVLFLAFFLAAVGEMNLSRRATLAWMYTLLLSALVVVETGILPGWLPGIPALVPMGIAVLIANKRHGAFTRQEKRDLKIGAVFAIFCAAGIVFGARALIKPQPKPLVDKNGEVQLGSIRIGPLGPGMSFYVGAVEPNSAGTKAGIRRSDEIVTINGWPTKRLTQEQLEAVFAQPERGATLTFKHKGEMKVNTTVLPLK